MMQWTLCLLSLLVLISMYYMLGELLIFVLLPSSRTMLLSFLRKILSFLSLMLLGRSLYRALLEGLLYALEAPTHMGRTEIL